MPDLWPIVWIVWAILIFALAVMFKRPVEGVLKKLKNLRAKNIAFGEVELDIDNEANNKKSLPTAPQEALSSEAKSPNESDDLPKQILAPVDERQIEVVEKQIRFVVEETEQELSIKPSKERSLDSIETMLREVLHVLRLPAGDTKHRSTTREIGVGIGTDTISTWPQNFRRKEPIRVGVLQSLSGTMAWSEAGQLDAAVMAIEEINRAGGVLERPLEVIFEDGASDPAQFRRKAMELITRDRVCSIFGCWTSASRRAVVDVVETGRNLLWYPVGYEGYESSPNVIYGGPTPNQKIIPTVEWCLENDWKRLFLVGSDYNYSLTANWIIKNQLQKHGAYSVGEAYKPLGDMNWEIIVHQIIKSQPAVVISSITGDSNAGFYRELPQFGIKHDICPVINVSGLGEVGIQYVGPRFTEGHYYAGSYFQSLKRKENDDFVAKFKDRYGWWRVISDPMEATYFQVHQFAKAVENAVSIGPMEIAGAARGLSFEAPSGRVTIDEKNQHTWRDIRIGQVLDTGRIMIVKDFEHAFRPIPYPYDEMPPVEFLLAGVPHID